MKLYNRPSKTGYTDKKHRIYGQMKPNIWPSEAEYPASRMFIANLALIINKVKIDGLYCSNI